MCIVILLGISAVNCQKYPQFSGVKSLRTKGFSALHELTKLVYVCIMRHIFRVQERLHALFVNFYV